MFATTFPSQTTVREEIGSLEQLQLMLLDLILTLPLEACRLGFLAFPELC